ncbi:MAG: aspartyl/asparaginyl beta-hydroxylase domain-containing protein [Bacteriovorax sp.]|nr:aspartyl/asparaginyl beta-hydroxylase domain-containing protein [Bacteriovorax sp.]
MIIKLELKIDIQKLISYLEFVKKTYPPFMKKNGPWGGWSITSSNGEVHDGWQAGEKINDLLTTEQEKAKIKSFFSITKFDRPTPIYTNEIEELLKLINNSIPNMKISRVRIAILKPHLEETAYWHKDGEAQGDEKVFRLHIPIITNEQCIFEYSTGKHHLIADGSIYLIDISKQHRVINSSNENRFHLIADVKKI